MRLVAETNLRFAALFWLSVHVRLLPGCGLPVPLGIEHSKETFALGVHRVKCTIVPFFVRFGKGLFRHRVFTGSKSRKTLQCILPSAHFLWLNTTHRERERSAGFLGRAR